MCAGAGSPTGDWFSTVLKGMALPRGWNGVIDHTVMDEGLDDGYVNITLPFSLKLFGNSYTTAHVGSNGYISFGCGSNAYTGFSAKNPECPTLFIIAADNYAQRIGYRTDYDTYILIRYEAGLTPESQTVEIAYEVGEWGAVFGRGTLGRVSKGTLCLLMERNSFCPRVCSGGDYS